MYMFLDQSKHKLTMDICSFRTMHTNYDNRIHVPPYHAREADKCYWDSLILSKSNNKEFEIKICEILGWKVDIRLRNSLSQMAKAVSLTFSQTAFRCSETHSKVPPIIFCRDKSPPLWLLLRTPSFLRVTASNFSHSKSGFLLFNFTLYLLSNMYSETTSKFYSQILPRLIGLINKRNTLNFWIIQIKYKCTRKHEIYSCF